MNRTNTLRMAPLYDDRNELSEREIEVAVAIGYTMLTDRGARAEIRSHVVKPHNPNIDVDMLAWISL